MRYVREHCDPACIFWHPKGGGMRSRQDSCRGKTDRRKTEAVQLLTRALELLNPVTLSSTLLHVHYVETDRKKKKTFLEKKYT